MIADKMRDTKRDSAAGGRSAAGSGGFDARRRRSHRVVEALGDELGKLLHPHGYRGDSRARRRASVPTALAAAVARENRRRGTRRREAHCDVGVATPRVVQDAIRPPANPRRDGRDGNAPSLPLVGFSSPSPSHRLGPVTPRPLPEGWRIPLLKPTLISICARFTTRRWKRSRGIYPSLLARDDRIPFGDHPTTLPHLPLSLLRSTSRATAIQGRYIYLKAERGRRGYAGN